MSVRANSGSQRADPRDQEQKLNCRIAEEPANKAAAFSVQCALCGIHCAV